MSLTYLQSLVGKRVILLNFIYNPFLNKIVKFEEKEGEQLLYIDLGTKDFLQHRITHPGIYFITDVHIVDVNYVIYLKREVSLKHFSAITFATFYEYYIQSYATKKYKIGNYEFDAVEFEVNGLKSIKFNYKKYIIVKARRGYTYTAVCISDNVFFIAPTPCTDFFTVE